MTPFKKQRQLILVLLFLQSFCGLSAQTDTNPLLIKTRIVPLGFKGQIRDIGLWKDGEFEELWIPSSYFPEAVDYRGPNPITLVTMVANPEGVNVPVPVAQAFIPEGTEEALLLMTPLPPEKMPAPPADDDTPAPPVAPVRYGIKVVDFSPVVFPDMSFLVWNLTGRPLLGIVGDASFRAAPQQFALIQPDIQGKPKALDAKILYADDPEKLSYTSRKWFIQPGQKFMVIMTADPNQPHRYQIKTIDY